jgi:hypothetical protein
MQKKSFSLSWGSCKAQMPAYPQVVKQAKILRIPAHFVANSHAFAEIPARSSWCRNLNRMQAIMY